MAGTKDGNKSRAVNSSAIKLNNDVYSNKIQSGPFCLRNSFNGPSFRTEDFMVATIFYDPLHNL